MQTQRQLSRVADQPKGKVRRETRTAQKALNTCPVVERPRVSPVNALEEKSDVLSDNRGIRDFGALQLTIEFCPQSVEFLEKKEFFFGQKGITISSKEFL